MNALAEIKSEWHKVWDELWAEFKERIKIPLRVMSLGLGCILIGMIMAFTETHLVPRAEYVADGSFHLVMTIGLTVDVVLMLFGLALMVTGHIAYMFPSLQKYLKRKT